MKLLCFAFLALSGSAFGIEIENGIYGNTQGTGCAFEVQFNKNTNQGKFFTVSHPFSRRQCSKTSLRLFSCFQDSCMYIEQAYSKYWKPLFLSPTSFTEVSLDSTTSSNTPIFNKIATVTLPPLYFENETYAKKAIMLPPNANESWSDFQILDHARPLLSDSLKETAEGGASKNCEAVWTIGQCEVVKSYLKDYRILRKARSQVVTISMTWSALVMKKD